MQALILASGRGSRLLPLTHSAPKSLTPIHDRTVLEIELNHLLALGIKDIIITVGYFGDKIAAMINQKYRGENITLVDNPRHCETNYIYSMWLAKSALKQMDLIVMHGDVVFESRVLEMLINTNSENVVLINKDRPPPEKDFKALVVDNHVKKIGVDVTGENAFFCPPIYKFSADGFSKWMAVIDKYVSSENVNVYAEEALNEVIGNIDFVPTPYRSEFCMEIDTLEDLVQAKKESSSLTC